VNLRIIPKNKLWVDIRPWFAEDLLLLTQLLGVPGMTEYIGGPETAEQLQQRHQRYCRSSEMGVDLMFRNVVGPERDPRIDRLLEIDGRGSKYGEPVGDTARISRERN